MADGEGLKICSTHTSYERLRDETQAAIDEHLLWECEYPAIGGLPQSYRTAGGEGFKKFAKEASGVARKLAKGVVTGTDSGTVSTVDDPST